MRMKRFLALLLLILSFIPLYADVCPETALEVTTGPSFTHAFSDSYPIRSSLLSDVQIRGGINAGKSNISLLFAYSYNTKTLTAGNIRYIDYSTARAGLRFSYEMLPKLELTLSTDFGFIFLHQSEMKAFILNGYIGLDYRVLKALSLITRLQAGYLNNAVTFSLQMGFALVSEDN